VAPPPSAVSFGFADSGDDGDLGDSLPSPHPSTRIQKDLTEVIPMHLKLAQVSRISGLIGVWLSDRQIWLAARSQRLAACFQRASNYCFSSLGGKWFTLPFVRPRVKQKIVLPS
jgi:hypothetical protein